MSTPKIGVPPPLDIHWAENMLSSPPLSMAEVTLAARIRWEALTQADSEDRLTLLMSGEWGFNTDHIRQVNSILEEFLGTSSKRQIRQLAGQAVDAGQFPQAVAEKWFTGEQRDRLRGLVGSTEVPDKPIVMLYACLEVHKAAEAAYLLQKHRRQPRPDFDSVVRTPEERADDLRWANAV